MAQVMAMQMACFLSLPLPPWLLVFPLDFRRKSAKLDGQPLDEGAALLSPVLRCENNGVWFHGRQRFVELPSA